MRYRCPNGHEFHGQNGATVYDVPCTVIGKWKVKEIPACVRK